MIVVHKGKKSLQVTLCKSMRERNCELSFTVVGIWLSSQDRGAGCVSDNFTVVIGSGY